MTHSLAARIFAAAAVAALVMADQPQAVFGYEPVKLHPIDGGHWQAMVGLPDTTGFGNQGLVRLVDGSDDHPEVAVVTGYDRQATSAIGSLGFAVRDLPGGIIPCVRIAFVDPAGNLTDVMLLPTDRVGWIAEPVAGRTGWTALTYSGQLPEGKIVSIELGLHVAQAPIDPVFAIFDNVKVNEKVWSAADDNRF